MNDIEQRAHDLAIALAMKIADIDLNVKLANASNSGFPALVNIDAIQIADTYSKLYDELKKHLSKED